LAYDMYIGTPERPASLATLHVVVVAGGHGESNKGAGSRNRVPGSRIGARGVEQGHGK
jgi:hypothetical protein